MEQLLTIVNRNTLLLMADVANGNVNLQPFMKFLWDFRDRDKILEWLVANRITGIDLEQWLKIIWGNSRLSMVRYILMKLEKSDTPPSIFLGGEYKPWG